MADRERSGSAPSSAGARGIRCGRGRRRCSRRCCRGSRSISTRPPPRDLRALFPGRRRRRAPRDRLRRRRAPDRRSRTHPRTGFIGVEPFVNGMAKALAAIAAQTARQYPAASSATRPIPAGLAAAGLARARRSDLSRSVAEAAALEAALRAGRERRRDRAHPAAGRRVPLRHRHARTTPPGRSRICMRSPRFRMDGRARRRLAAARGRASPRRATRPRPSAKAARRAT